MGCKHWFEEDGEYCKAMRCMTACCGAEDQCEDVRYYDANERKVAFLRHHDSIGRAKAFVEAYMPSDRKSAFKSRLKKGVAL